MVPSLADTVPPSRSTCVGQQAHVPGDERTRVGRWAGGVLGSRVGGAPKSEEDQNSVIMPEWGFEGCVGVGWMRG